MYKSCFYLAAVLSIDQCKFGMLTHATPDVLDGLLAVVGDCDVDGEILSMVVHLG